MLYQTITGGLDKKGSNTKREMKDRLQWVLRGQSRFPLCTGVVSESSSTTRECSYRGVDAPLSSCYYNYSPMLLLLGVSMNYSYPFSQ